MIFFYYLLLIIIFDEKNGVLQACKSDDESNNVINCSGFSNFTELNFSSFNNSKVSKLVLEPEFIYFDANNLNLNELNILPNSTLVLRNFSGFSLYFPDGFGNFSYLILDSSNLTFLNNEPEIISTTTILSSTTENYNSTDLIDLNSTNSSILDKFYSPTFSEYIIIYY